MEEVASFLWVIYALRELGEQEQAEYGGWWQRGLRGHLLLLHLVYLLQLHQELLLEAACHLRHFLLTATAQCRSFQNRNNFNLGQTRHDLYSLGRHSRRRCLISLQFRKLLVYFSPQVLLAEGLLAESLLLQCFSEETRVQCLKPEDLGIKHWKMYGFN